MTPRRFPARQLMMVGAATLALTLTSCGATAQVDSGGKPVGATTAITPVPTTASPTSAGEKPTKIGSGVAGVIAGRYIPVKRNGQAPRPTISAPAGTFKAPVRYTDGTTLQVVAISQSVATGQGPGNFPGRPITRLTLRLTNGSGKPINVNEVVVTASYGSPKRLASPVYDASSHDFGGIAAPGASVDATYVFSIPTADLASVVMIVDFDGVHVSATFAGPAK